MDGFKRTKLVIAMLAVIGVAGLQACGDSKKPAPTNANKAPEPAAGAPAAPQITPVDAKVTESESTFDHNRVEHKKVECSFCHQRTDNEPTPKFPGHSACNDCHQQDFSSTKTALCAGCHKTPIEAEPQLISFPGRLKQLGLKGFSHRDHMNPEKMPAGTEKLSCASCHRFGGRGVEASFPRHAECYSCHTHQAGEKLGECATCHTERAASMTYSAGGSAYSLYNFRHGTHVKRTTCDRCHRTSEPASKTSSDILQISTARGQRHNSTCFTCHSRAKENVCSKCHVGSVPF